MEQPGDVLGFTLLSVSHQVGDQLVGLYSDKWPASKVFRSIGVEVKSFHASYQIIRPYLQAPLYFVTEAGISLIRNIHDDIETICEELSADVDRLHSQHDQPSRRKSARNSYHVAFYSLCGDRPASNDWNRSMERFLAQRNNYELQLCQLQYGNLLLKLILQVLAYSQNISQNTGSGFRDYSGWLLHDLVEARREIRSKERREKRRRELTVEAGWWWDRDGLDDNIASPLAAMSHIWVNPDARVSPRVSPDVRSLQMRIQQMNEDDRRQREAFRAEITRLTNENNRHVSDIVHLTRENESLHQERDELQREKDALENAIDKLYDRIEQFDNALRDEQTARRDQRERADHFRRQSENLQDQLRNRPREATVEMPASPYGSQRSHHGQRERERSSHHIRASSRSQRDPPVTYETQRHHQSRSSRDPSPSVDWSGTTRVEGSQSRNRGHAPSGEPPPINFQTKPYRRSRYMANG